MSFQKSKECFLRKKVVVCREDISLKCSIIARHIRHILSAKHKQSRVKLAMKDSWEKDIAKVLVV